MALSSYLVWFIAMAVATIAILTLGTLAAADLLPRRGARHEAPTSQDGREPAPSPIGTEQLVDAQGR